MPIDPVARDLPVYGAAACAYRLARGGGPGRDPRRPGSRGRRGRRSRPGRRSTRGRARLLRWSAGGRSEPEVVTDAGGRPLGLHPGPDGGLHAADAFKGFLHLAAHDTLRTLTTTSGGTPLVFTNDLDTRWDGKTYFTDASVRFGQDAGKLDLLENRTSGRLCVHDPATGTRGAQ